MGVASTHGMEGGRERYGLQEPRRTAVRRVRRASRRFDNDKDEMAEINFRKSCLFALVAVGTNDCHRILVSKQYQD